MSGPRTSLDATLTRLSLDPTRAEVWVEGGFDQAVIAHVIKIAGLKRCVVNRIEDLEFPKELLAGDDLPGFKERVLLLTAHAREQDLVLFPNLLGVVDLDDQVLQTTSPDPIPNVMFADGTCMESFLWDPDVIGKLADLYVHVPDINAHDVMDELLPVLQELFLIKSAQHRLRLGCRLDSARSCVRVKRKRPIKIQFDRNSYMTKLLNTGGATRSRDQLEATVEQLRQICNQVPYPVFNGHDFMDLLGYALAPFAPSRQQAMLTEPYLSRAGRLAVPWDRHLATSPLLVDLLARLQAYA